MSEKQETAIYRLGEWVIQRRIPILVLILIGTIFFGWQATKVRLKNPTIDLFPKNHPYVETYVEYEDTFGGANVVIMALTVKEGDIFNTETLTKIKNITKAIELLPAVNNYQVLSIAQRKIKRSSVMDNAYSANPVMWPKIPQTQEEIDHLKHVIYTTGRLHGSLVSHDDKGALIVAGFFERGLQNPGDNLRQVIYNMVEGEQERKETLEAFASIAGDQAWNLDDTLYDAIIKIVSAEEDNNHEVQMIGRPVLLGFVQNKMDQIFKIFLLTVGTIVFALALFYRDVKGVLVPVLTALISAVWGIGFLGLLGYHFNPLVIVVPFVISARALSHSVQLIERFIGEYEKVRNRRTAAVRTFSGLFKPGMLSIVTDAAGVFIVILTPIPLMEKLAIMGGFWVMSIIISDILFNPILLSLLPAPRRAHATHGILYRGLYSMGGWSYGWQRWPILGVTLIVFGIGFYYAKGLVIGDVHPGTPLLWPDSEYNIDTDKIGQRFGNTEILSIVVEGGEKNSIKAPIVLKTMEGLQRELEQMPEVATTSSIADLVPMITRIFSGDNPKWELIPADSQQAGFYLEMIFSGAEPGDLARFVTNDLKDASISVYLRDHKGETLRKVVAKAKEYIEANPMIAIGGKEGGVPGLILNEGETKEIAKFRLAGNYGGLLAAVNEAIVRSQGLVTALAFFLVFLFCSLTFKSALAGGLFLVPIAISNYLTYALMGALGIGLDVNALPVVSLGVGLGVDYGVYIISRIDEEFRERGDLKEAVATAIATAGQAVVKEATTMVAGIIFWAWSFLRFQAEMGILLAFWMIVSMLGGLIVLPTLIMLIKPKFIMKNAPKSV